MMPNNAASSRLEAPASVSGVPFMRLQTRFRLIRPFHPTSPWLFPSHEPMLLRTREANIPPQCWGPARHLGAVLSISKGDSDVVLVSSSYHHHLLAIVLKRNDGSRICSWYIGQRLLEDI